MIKMDYKKSGLALAIAGFLLVSVFVSYAEVSEGVKEAKEDRAVAMQQKKDDKEETRAQNVCDRIASFADNLNQKASQQENTIRTRQKNRLGDWEEKTTEADKKLKDKRETWNQNRQEQFSRLESAAKTDEQKKAVNQFEAAVKAAIQTRQAAVDAAISTFRAGVKAAIQTRKTQMDNLVSSFESGRSVAISAAKADCAAGKDAKTVRENFQASLKSARTKAQTDRQEITRVGANMQSLIQARRMAVEKAMSDFKAAMEQARLTLKKAFSDQTETSSMDTSESSK